MRLTSDKRIFVPDKQRSQPVAQASNMPIEQKRFAVVNAKCFKDTIAIQEAAIENRNRRFLFLNKIAVEKNFHLMQAIRELHGRLHR